MKVLNTFSALRQKLSTTQGKKFLQFSMFVLIAFIFWASLTLNETFIYDIRYPVKVTNVPDSVTIISEIPNSIKINVKAKGYYFFKNKLQSLPTIDIDFNKYKFKNRILLGSGEMQELIQNMFGLIV